MVVTIFTLLYLAAPSLRNIRPWLLLPESDHGKSCIDKRFIFLLHVGTESILRSSILFYFISFLATVVLALLLHCIVRVPPKISASRLQLRTQC